MRADSQVLHDEAAGQIKRALLSYDGDPIHVTIFVLSRCRDWNELQADLARTDLPSDPERVSAITAAVRDHIESELRTYLKQ